MIEKRDSSRFPFNIPVKIKDGHSYFKAHCLNLSKKGILLEDPNDLKLHIGDICTLELILDNSTITLTIQAELKRLHQNQKGFQFQEIDLDSFIHLRRIIELNSENPDDIFW